MGLLTQLFRLPLESVGGGLSSSLWKMLFCSHSSYLSLLSLAGPAPLIYITPWSFKASDCNPWLRNTLGFWLTTSRSEGSPPHPRNVLLSGFCILLYHLPNCPFIFNCLYFSPFFSTSKKVTRETWHRLCSPASISVFFSSLSLYFLLFWSLPKSLVKCQ